MKKLLITLATLTFSLSAFSQDYKDKITLVIHGGAGTITRQNMTPEKEKAYRETLDKALETGYAVLAKGGTSLDAVEATIHVMEDSPLFNAGKGAVFTHDGKNEMDAAIMDGKTLKAGAIAGVTTIKNPISTARKVMDKSEHVMLIGKGAEQFAKLQGETIVPSSYFFTQTRWDGLQKAIKEEKVELDHSTPPATPPTASADRPKREKKTNKSVKKSPLGARGGSENIFTEGKKYGTVGCVALDQYGNLAAGTSTGGMTNKRWNRVGDAPIIGAGTYADNETCAISATGHGEYFIRAVVGHDISSLMAYKGISLQEAADEVVMKKLVKMGGEGGAIGVDKNGNVAMPFNSEGMYRGFMNAKGEKVIKIYKE